MLTRYKNKMEIAEINKCPECSYDDKGIVTEYCKTCELIRGKKTTFRYLTKGFKILRKEV